MVSCSKGAKHNHTGCVDAEGKLYMWGDPYKGQLGHYSEKEAWTHEEKALYGTPILIQTAEPIKSVINGGIHSAILTVTGRVYTFGCGSDGRLGHPGFEGHRYLYKES